MKMTISKKIAMIAVTLLVGAALMFGPSMLAGYEAVFAEAAETPVFSVRTTQAQVQTLRAFLDVNGDVVSTQQTDVFPDVAGRVASVNVSLGSYVRRGDVIAEIDPSRPGAIFMNSRVIAPISGVVSRTPVSVGMTVNPNTSLAVISANGSLEINARIPEREIAGLATGLSAEVSLQAYPGETFSATINRLSPVLDSVSRARPINLIFDQNDTRIHPGMFARVRINTRSYTDVLAVPAEAITRSRGVNVVYVVEDYMGLPFAVRREVITGVTLQGWTEIRSGLEEGQTIVVQGQQLLNGGERLRIVGSN